MRRRGKCRALALSLMLGASMAIVNGALARPGYVTHVTDADVHRVAFNPNTNRYYVDSYDYIVEIDASTNRELSRVHLDFDAGVESLGMALNPVTNKLYVGKDPYTSWGPNSAIPDYVQVIDLSRMAVVKQIQVGAGVAKIGINSVTNRIYVANYHSGTVSVIDGSTDEVISSILHPDGGELGYPYGIAVNERTNTTYLSSNGGGGAIYSIDGATSEVKGEVFLKGSMNFKLVLNPETNRLYVGDSNPWVGQENLIILNAATLAIVKRVPLGAYRSVSSLALNLERNLVYVGIYEDDGGSISYPPKLLVIDGFSNATVDMMEIGGEYGASDMAINPAAHVIYMAHDGTLSVISEDLTAPVVSVVQQHGDLLRPGEKIRGTVTDDFAGVEGVQISYTSATGSGSLTVDLVCDQPRFNCTFSAWPPAGPQAMVVSITSTDRFANASKPQQIALLKGI